VLYVPFMGARPYIPGFIIILLALGVSRVDIYQPHENEALSLDRPPFSSGASQVLSDLDGDGRADLGTLNSGAFHHNIELHLSRTDEWAVLPVRAAVSGDGALSAQDIDGDGDIDLLWQRALPPHVVMVWLNDGAGQFECLCPLPSFQRGFAHSHLGVRVSRARHTNSGVSPERTPEPGRTLTFRWVFHPVATRGPFRPEVVRSVSCLKRALSTRSPPLLGC
jgi:hypothetical protein